MQETKKKNNLEKILIIGMVAIGLLAILGGASYAFWTANVSQTTTNKVITDCLNLTIKNVTNEIRIEKAFPLTDSEAENLTPYTFTIENTCNSTVSYTANLEIMDATNRLASNFVDLKVNTDDHKILNSYTAATESYYTNKYNNNYTVVEKYQILTGTLGGRKSVNHSIKLWIDKNVTVEDDVMNKTFISKVTLNGVLSNREIAFNSLEAGSITDNSLNLVYDVTGNNASITCNYSTTLGSYTENCSNILASNATISGLMPDTTYYYQVCASKDTVSECKIGSAKTLTSDVTPTNP